MMEDEICQEIENLKPEGAELKWIATDSGKAFTLQSPEHEKRCFFRIPEHMFDEDLPLAHAKQIVSEFMDYVGERFKAGPD